MQTTARGLAAQHGNATRSTVSFYFIFFFSLSFFLIVTQYQVSMHARQTSDYSCMCVSLGRISVKRLCSRCQFRGLTLQGSRPLSSSVSVKVRQADSPIL